LYLPERFKVTLSVEGDFNPLTLIVMVTELLAGSVKLVEKFDPVPWVPLQVAPPLPEHAHEIPETVFDVNVFEKVTLETECVPVLLTGMTTVICNGLLASGVKSSIDK
jgi:hypothetical protein